MALYNLNDALKKSAKERERALREIRLDDVSRVRVLSPSRKVAKRFLQNRLAVFGAALLIAMFVFSFVGPLFYAYGQKQLFYKYETQTVDYALARENTTYTGYAPEAGAAVSDAAANRMNSTIKEMEKAGREEAYFTDGTDALYAVRLLKPNIYMLSSVDCGKVCTFGSGRTLVGTLDTVNRKFDAAASVPGDGFVETAAKACKGKSAEFDFGGVRYTAEKDIGKTYKLYCESDGYKYIAEPMNDGFEKAAEASGGEPFEFEGRKYLVCGGAVYRLGEEHPKRLYTKYILDMRGDGAEADDKFLTDALMASCGDGRFSFGGTEYTVEANREGGLAIKDGAGNEYADLSAFVIRRYDGADTMSYDLKARLHRAIEDMKTEGRKQTSCVCPLPRQQADGQYAYDENGNLMQTDTEMRITERDTGEYLINCDQIMFQVDVFAAPSAAHLLGTDGDGFDVLARIMYGGRISLIVGFVVVFLESFLGIVFGGLAGYYGGWVDNLIMRLVDIFYCLPTLPILIILGAMMDAVHMDTYVRLLIMMAIMGIMGWAGIARMVRGQILALREQDFMVAAEATGLRVKSRIFRHLVPNVMPQMIVSATMGMGSTILTESTLSYLGLGVKYPLATWGTIINSVSSASAMAHYAYIWIPVGLLICMTVIAFNFVGDGLRDAYDPKSK